MIGDLDRLVAKHRRAGVLIDTNILLLYLVGRFRPELIGSNPRLSTFTRSDYGTLARFLLHFACIATLPHVLAEVNSLSSSLKNLVQACRPTFREVISELSEGAVSSSAAAARPEFEFLGLTDAAIVQAADSDPRLVLTDDLRLSVNLAKSGVDVVNFNHLRSFND